MTKVLKQMSRLGFRFNKSKNFEGVQPRFVFRKTITGMSEDEVLASYEEQDTLQCPRCNA